MTRLNAAERQAQRIREMEAAAAAITPGEEWIFRAQDKGRSQRVLVIGPERTGSSIQMEVQFLDGERAGHRRLVGLLRLKGPWSGVEAYDSLDRKRRQIEDSHNTDDQRYPVARIVFERLVPTHVAERLGWTSQGMVVHDITALAGLCQLPVEELAGKEECVETESGLVISASAFLRLAQAACAANPDGMRADLVTRDRRLLKPPGPREEWSYEMDAWNTQILHEWCGIPRLDAWTLLVTMENEVIWQRTLVGAAIDTLRRCGARTVADNLELLSRDGPSDEEERDDDDDQYQHEYEQEPSYVSEDSWPW